jgi:tetratricopeptide (TPR) repeat protein
VEAGAVSAAARSDGRRPRPGAARRAALRAVTFAILAVAAAGCSRFVILNDPLTAAEHNDLGVAYEASGKPDLAKREYRAALKLDPRLVRARVNLGNLEAAAGRWQPAEDCYRRALREAPNDGDALNNLAVALMRQGRSLVEAESLATRAVASGGGRDSVYRATLSEVRAARR